MTQLYSTRWLVCYDIRDPKRLGKIFRLLKKHGTPMQYSVFLLETSAAGIRKILLKMTAIMDTRSDDIRVYGLPNQPQFDTIGESMLPLGVMHDHLTSKHAGAIGSLLTQKSDKSDSKPMSALNFFECAARI